MIEIENKGPKIQAVDIEMLEERIGASLPESYCAFLLEFNGGTAPPCEIAVPGLEGGSADLQVLFGIGRAIKSSTLEWNQVTLKDRMKSGMLPVGVDSGGNVFCLLLRGQRAGAVFYCDLQSVFGQFDKEPSFYQVAPSFEQFLSSFHCI